MTQIILKHFYRDAAPLGVYPMCNFGGLAILAYSIHNLVSFQQVLNEPAMFVILGIGAAYTRTEKTL